MSRKHPYSFVPLHERPLPRRDWLSTAVVFVTGLTVGIALMAMLGLISGL